MSETTWVREVGQVVDQYGIRIHIGIDHGCVTVQTFAGCTLTAGQREQFTQLWAAASLEADADTVLLLALDEVTQAVAGA